MDKSIEIALAMVSFKRNQEDRLSKAVPFINTSMSICGGFYGSAVVPWMLDKRRLAYYSPTVLYCLVTNFEGTWSCSS